MATTIRIVHYGTEPLDGSTPLTESILHTLQDDPALGLAILVLPPGVRFGVFDPSLLQRTAGTNILRSVTLTSRGAPEHLSGSCVALRPPGFENPEHDRVLADLGTYREGLIPRMPAVPCPPGHSFVFDTCADGKTPGPHLIQLTFELARLPNELSPEANR